MADHDNFDDEELVSSNTNQRNWRGILIALMVIVIVLALIVTSVVLLTPPDEGPRIKGTRFRLQDILGHDFQPLRFNGSWVSSDEIIFKDEFGGISLMHVSNLSVTSLMSNQSYQRLNPSRFQLSPDKRYLLLALNVQKLFRHSYLAQYIVYDIVTRNEFPVRPIPDVEDHPFLLLAEWTPKGHSLVMVQDYDIYFRPTPISHIGYRITKNAIPGVVSNGVPDWLYEEEILGTNSAIWMSHDGHMLVFASFNDSLVEELRFPWYGAGTEGRLYPDIRSLRYPKPGTRNPQVTLTVADLADPSNIRMRQVKPPVQLYKQEYYFTAVSWISLTEISVVWLNRAQNLSIVSVCKTPTWHCVETQRVSGDGEGWVDMGDSPLFSPDGAHYITVAPVRDGNAGYFRHAMEVNIMKRRTLPLTHGRYEVVRILAWDHSNDVIYFLGIPQGKPGQQHLYRVASVPPRSGAALQPPVCLTCVPEPPPSQPPFYIEDIPVITKNKQWDDEWADDDTVMTTPPPRKRKNKKQQQQKPQDVEPPCLYHNAIFSPGSASYYVLECLGPGIPTSTLYKASLPKPKILYYLQNNTALRERVSKMAMPQIKSFAVQISDEHEAYVRLILPPGLREDEITRYPLIVQVYGGPGSQLVTERWRIDWNTYLTGNKDYIVAQIDGRGSGGQGHKLLHQVYYKLGTVEVSDQIEVTEYLRDNLHYVDKRRVAVWGWSYGGFVAALALASPNNVFHCAISVAPVTNWRLYDSAYTERYMGLPNVTDNYKGYDEADISKKAHLLKDKMFYLVHGSADDNVHLQQSMALVKALSEAGALFRQQVYPDESHGLGGVKKHLYRSMGQFLDDCFKKQVPPETKAGLLNGGE
ncbi:PREDICTED: inactive dipeptidyl peptidase 10 [Nicrophorus vespilloides]|uniref:Inactive dipeptidyl peptidase 10 n=1 Tax=Nicrophorus vespilloides TaxID=110193 RepID=A0ABM1MD84_NICVS|nr:PREDICTED: inactive dipeptidyl peptidase 10 [Nicrophorus vespilloides]